MGDFYIGSFYGLTAPLALLTSKYDFNSIVDNVDSREGLQGLSNLRIELLQLKEVLLGGEVILTSENYGEQFERIGKVIGIESEGDFRRFVVKCKTFFHTGKGTNPGLTEEEWRMIEEQLSKVPRQLTGKVRCDGEVITLTEEEQKIVSIMFNRAIGSEEVNYIDYLIGKIDSVQKSKFSESQIYLGQKLYKVLNTVNLNMQNNLINENYYKGLEGLTVPAQKYELEKRLSDCEFLLELANEKEESSKPIPVDLTYSKDKWECIMNSCDVDESSRRLWEELEDSNVEKTVLSDVKIFKEIVGFESLVGNYDINYFNQMLGLAYTEEELMKVFVGLQRIGLVGLTVYNIDFYIYGLKRGLFIGNYNQGKLMDKNSDVYLNILMLYRDIRSKLEKYKEGVTII